MTLLASLKALREAVSLRIANDQSPCLTEQMIDEHCGDHAPTVFEFFAQDMPAKFVVSNGIDDTPDVSGWALEYPNRVPLVIDLIIRFAEARQ